ncbi:uncharacterized protein LOC125192324 [Salvia hispanica]|uniref:uncharacterized protein LOC125192324 n=1 Tax=Salvia hispanica TaxID=49212 RepID=UPI0020092ECC|nr:uncharacterized protein LOC125192324 [Salvia hispanica]
MKSVALFYWTMHVLKIVCEKWLDLEFWMHESIYCQGAFFKLVCRQHEVKMSQFRGHQRASSGAGSLQMIFPWMFDVMHDSERRCCREKGLASFVRRCHIEK